MAQVLDYSAGFPGAAAIARAGYVGAVRYIGFPSNRKCTNAAELRDFTLHGLGMALVFEQSITNWKGGRAAGERDARLGRNHANAIGFPSNRPIYMAVDTDVVSAADFNIMLDYMRGANSTLGGPALTGVYGEADVVDRCRQAGVAEYQWQTKAWSRGRTTTANLLQLIGSVYVSGIACDANNVLTPDWGQHNATEEDTLSWNDSLTFTNPETGKPATYPAGDWLLWTNYFANQIPAILAGVGALTAAVADGDLDSEVVLQRIETAVRETTNQVVTQTVLPALRTTVAEVLGEDNTEQADAIVSALAARLQPGA
jgi:hypothetical protein